MSRIGRYEAAPRMHITSGRRPLDAAQHKDQGDDGSYVDACCTVKCPDIGIMWVIFDHLRPWGHIMPDLHPIKQAVDHRPGRPERLHAPWRQPALITERHPVPDSTSRGSPNMNAYSLIEICDSGYAELTVLNGRLLHAGTDQAHIASLGVRSISGASPVCPRPLSAWAAQVRVAVFRARRHRPRPPPRTGPA